MQRVMHHQVMGRPLGRASIVGGSSRVSSRHLIYFLLFFIFGCGTSVDQRQEEARIGSYNQDSTKVSKAQLIMMYSGFATFADGLMGPETRDTLKEFQMSRGLPVTGYIGDATWTELMKFEQQEGPFTVERLQWGLRNSGFDPGSIDGRVGGMTLQALSKFQQAKGLKETGRLNPESWAALQSSMPP
ncbi:MAG: peptidoglycan-binding protein [Elusimicrobia bacterium]|nr:peptidoglycan-binding protein [Elusimicrobiota bacterium]